LTLAWQNRWFILIVSFISSVDVRKMLTSLWALPLVVQLLLLLLLLLDGLKVHLILTKGVCKSTNKLTGKTVIITGANTGIGKETAIDLAKRGARVILACRDLKKAADAKGNISIGYGFL
jgi:NADPH:quinone reductase-like Zn-dependent oxidoreductase